MPRLSTRLLAQARRINPLLIGLLRVCRDLPSARNELRWLQDHVLFTQPRLNAAEARNRLKQLCHLRANGRPLQYLLGSEFFGDLELQCRHGVFIPRPETAHAVTYLVSRLEQDGLLQPEMRVLDVCAGTGAMSLLLAHQCEKGIFSHNLKTQIHISGIDISKSAVRLARHNAMLLHHQGYLSERISTEYIQSDIFSPTEMDQPWESQDFDVVLCNPPYISIRGLWRDTARSVRIYEPRNALIPTLYQGNGLEYPEDAFYHRLINSKSRVILFEVAHMEQAIRVAKLGIDGGWNCEIWRDFPDVKDASTKEPSLPNITVGGSGEGRSVYLWRRP